MNTESETLTYGEIYNFNPFGSVRRGIYLGESTSNRMKYRHLIVSKRYRGEEPIVYRFREPKLKGDTLEAKVFVRSRINPKEKAYLIDLLKKKNL